MMIYGRAGYRVSVTARPPKLTLIAWEKSTYVVTAEFQNENDESVVPNTIQWSLLDEDENIVNGRQDISITPAASIDIFLSGNDLPFGSELTVLVEAEYNSGTETDLPLKEAVRFDVLDTPGV